jgi:hypothetical protein
MFKKTSPFLCLLLMVVSFSIAGCTQQDMDNFKNGEPITSTYTQALTEKADALNTSLIDLNTEIDNILLQGTKETDAYVQGLLKKRDALVKERQALIESIKQRQDGKQLDENLRHSLDSLTESGMILRNTILPNPQQKSK